MSRHARTSVLVLAWTAQRGRAEAIAEVLGGHVHICYPRRLGAARHVPIRYALSSVHTVAVLLYRRPSVIVAQNPPVYPALLALISCWPLKARLVLDCHPAAFGAKDNLQGQVMLPATRWLARRSEAVLVTTEEYVNRVQQWGGKGIVLHEPPLAPELVKRIQHSSLQRSHSRPRVLFASVFAADEPLAQVAEAARLLPEVDFRVTGDPAKCPMAIGELPKNIELTGYLSLVDFLREMRQSQAVLSLTTDSTSVARSGYEATYLECPLIVSAVPAMRKNFPSAVACANRGSDIATAIRECLSDPPSPLVLGAAREIQQQRWVHQERALMAIVHPSKDCP